MIAATQAATFEQVHIKCAGGGNPVEIRQCLQESVVVGRILNIVNASVFRKRSQLYSSQQIQFVSSYRQYCDRRGGSLC